jgi:hypothetical protein
MQCEFVEDNLLSAAENRQESLPDFSGNLRARARGSYFGQQVNFFKNTEYRGLLCGFLNRAREV